MVLHSRCLLLVLLLAVLLLLLLLCTPRCALPKQQLKIPFAVRALQLRRGLPCICLAVAAASHAAGTVVAVAATAAPLLLLQLLTHSRAGCCHQHSLQLGHQPVVSLHAGAACSCKVGYFPSKPFGMLKYKRGCCRMQPCQDVRQCGAAVGWWRCRASCPRAAVGGSVRCARPRHCMRGQQAALLQRCRRYALGRSRRGAAAIGRCAGCPCCCCVAHRGCRVAGHQRHISSQHQRLQLARCKLLDGRPLRLRLRQTSDALPPHVQLLRSERRGVDGAAAAVLRRQRQRAAAPRLLRGCCCAMAQPKEPAPAGNLCVRHGQRDSRAAQRAKHGGADALAPRPARLLKMSRSCRLQSPAQQGPPCPPQPCLKAPPSQSKTADSNGLRHSGQDSGEPCAGGLSSCASAQRSMHCIGSVERAGWNTARNASRGGVPATSSGALLAPAPSTWRPDARLEVEVVEARIQEGFLRREQVAQANGARPDGGAGGGGGHRPQPLATLRA